MITTSKTMLQRKLLASLNTTSQSLLYGILDSKLADDTACEAEMASKRRRETTTPDTALIEIYEDLANENEEIRLRAAHSLLSKFARPASGSQTKIKTVLQRLFRGLCSSRKAARLGFSVALTEFLAQISQYPIEETGLEYKDIFDILDKATITEGSTSGQVCIIRTIN
jgi:DNA polymerase phi